MSLKTRTYKDLDLNFLPHPVTGDIIKKVDDNAIIASIKNLLSISKYEKPFHPEIYSSLKAHLFEQVDSVTSSAIENEIRSTISSYEPRVEIIELMAVPDYDNQGYTVTLSFFIVNRADPITIELFLERIR